MSRKPMDVAVLWLVSMALAAGAQAGQPNLLQKQVEHPLLPGVRSPEVWNTSWPSALHDKLLTGFSPLTCGMREAPRLWVDLQPSGRAAHAAFLEDEQQREFLLVQDGELRRVDAEGNIVWRRANLLALFYERLHGDGAFTLGALSGGALVLLDPRSGAVLWSFPFDGHLDVDKVRVAKVLSDFPGQQILVFPKHVTTGCLFAFRSGRREPELVWKTNDAAVANWSSPADHGVATIVEPNGSVIWNIRHHTINMHDSRTGRLLRRFEFKTGGGKRRNYGPCVIGQAATGEPLIAIASHHVQHHLNCFTRSQASLPELTHQRYFGEVYQNHGIHAWFPISGLGDADGDGGLDVVYSVRLIEPKPQTQTVVCQAATGKELVLPNVWLIGAADLDQDGRKEIFGYSDPRAEMPDQGTLEVYGFNGQGGLSRLYRADDTELVLRPVAPVEQPPEAAWCNVELQTPVLLPASQGLGALIRDRRLQKAKMLQLTSGAIAERAAPDILFSHDVLVAGKPRRDGDWRLVLQSRSGRLLVLDRRGETKCDLPLAGGDAPVASAEDLNGDGKCEVLVRSAQAQVEVFTIDPPNQVRRVWSAPFVGGSSRLSVPARDIDGNGRPDVLGASRTADGHLSVLLYSCKGEVLWESALPIVGSGEICGWMVGNFLGPNRAGVFVSAQQEQAREESYMLDGRNGRIVWTGSPQSTPRGVRPCNPVGLPVAFDADQDGGEDLILDYRDFVAILRGADGALLRGLTPTPSVPAGWCMAYNSYTPLLDPTGKLRFFVSLGHGGVGLLESDLTTEVWSHKPYYDTPARVAIIDVDGDGRLEAGYEESRSGWFVCRDFHSGRERWRTRLDGAGYGAPISADFDGDGKGEFLIGNVCLGADASGQGLVRWRSPAAAGWPAVADLDGDGQGEIILPSGEGLVHVLKAGPP